MDLESVLALDRPPPRWHMLPAFSGVLLLHAALLYGINLTDDMLQAASGEDQPVYVELVNAPPQPPVIPEPTAPPPQTVQVVRQGDATPLRFFRCLTISTARARLPQCRPEGRQVITASTSAGDDFIHVAASSGLAKRPGGSAAHAALAEHQRRFTTC